MADDLKRKAVTGFGWSFATQISGLFISVGLSAVLARLLVPRDYGLVAMINAFAGFGAVIVNFGFGDALVRKEVVGDRDLSTVFWASVAIGAALCAVLAGLSVPIARFYGAPDLVFLTILLAFNFLLTAAGIVPAAMLRRQIRFKEITIINIIGALGGGALGIVLAALGFGATALVCLTLGTSGIRLLLLYWRERWFPGFVFDRPALRSMTRFSVYLLGSNAINYWTRQLDNLLLGRFIGERTLGIYSRGYSFLLLAGSTLTKTVNAVLYPVLATIKHDTPRMRSIFLRVTKTVFLLSCFVSVVFFVLAEEVTWVLFGPKWMEVAPVMRALAVLSSYQSIIGLLGPLYLATGRTNLDFKVSLVVEPVIIVAIIIGVNWGVRGVIIGLYAAAVINFWPTSYYALKLIDLRIRGLYGSLVAPLVCALVVGGGAAALKFLVLPSTHYLVRLAILGPLVTVGYFGALYLLRETALFDVIALLRTRGGYVRELAGPGDRTDDAPPP